MVTKQELCKKIEEIFPHAGICGMDYDVEYDQNTQSWEMIVNNGSSRLRTFIKPEVVTNCLEGKSCDPLGMKISHIRPVTSPVTY
jgi:hypothetical protein